MRFAYFILLYIRKRNDRERSRCAKKNEGAVASGRARPQTGARPKKDPVPSRRRRFFLKMSFFSRLFSDSPLSTFQVGPGSRPSFRRSAIGHRHRARSFGDFCLGRPQAPHQVAPGGVASWRWWCRCFLQRHRKHPGASRARRAHPSRRPQ